MQKFPRRLPKYFVVAFLVMFFLGGKPIEFGQEASFFHGFYISKPLIRIGLGLNLSDVAIRASAGMKVFEVSDSFKLVADSVDEVRIKGQKEKLSEKFFIQIAQFKTRKGAESYAQKIKKKIQNQVYVAEDREEELQRRVYVVKVGDFITRDDALSFMKILIQAGIKDTWILREDVTEERSKPLWILVDDKLKPLSETNVLYFIPGQEQSFLSYNGRKYRGILILKSTRKGMVLVNVLNLEDYLKGVVPRELSPDLFGELEALKAQAVAARTYAIKNLGLYKDLGYDLCDTQKTQVYGGLSDEHPLSNRAVEETRSEVALYKGGLINALYMSTCGGKTERSEVVFDGAPVPYLVSTECTVENRAEYVLERSGIFSPVVINGRDISWETAFLLSLGIIPKDLAPSLFKEQASLEEATAWIRKVREILGKNVGEFNVAAESLTFPFLARLLLRALGWNERVERLLLKSETDYVLKDFPKIAREDRAALAFMVQAGFFPHDQEIANRDRTVTRAELALALAGILAENREWTAMGSFRTAVKDGFEFMEDGEVKPLKLAPDVFLFKVQNGVLSPASRLTLQGGEAAVWLERDGEVRMMEITLPPDTNVLDRSSRFNRWNQRISREDLEKRINLFYPVGRLVDIDIKKRGESGRVIDLQVNGEEGQVRIRGQRIRTVLNVRDTLFTVDRERDEPGRVAFFNFSGRGWGHGVGLCQVGAFGLAQKGADYKEILKKYYRGVKIEKLS